MKIPTELDKNPLGHQIASCMRAYKREERRWPTRLIALPPLLAKLTDEDLLEDDLDWKVAMCFNALGSTRLGRKLRGTGIEIHLIENLPAKVKEDIEEQTKQVRLPVILCRRRLSNQFYGMGIYDISSSGARVQAGIY